MATSGVKPRVVQPRVGGARTVLIVEDEPTLRETLAWNLEQDGYRVLEAASGAEGDRALASEPVAVALLDIRLGRDDGVAVARRMREHHPAVAVVFFTGSARTLDDATRALADGVIPKPFSLEELIETVQRLAPA